MLQQLSLFDEPSIIITHKPTARKYKKNSKLKLIKKQLVLGIFPHSLILLIGCCIKSRHYEMLLDIINYLSRYSQEEVVSLWKHIVSDLDKNDIDWIASYIDL